MSRRCIRIPNGIVCVSRDSKGPSKKDMAAVGKLLAMLREGRVPKKAFDTVHLDHPTGKSLGRSLARAVINAAIQPQPKNEKLIWQKVHNKDPKLKSYVRTLMGAVKCDRVEDVYFTPSGLSISGACFKFVKRYSMGGGLLKYLGHFQTLAP